MKTRVLHAASVNLACAIVLLAGCASTDHRDAGSTSAAPPAADPAARARAEVIARRVEATAKRTEAAEGGQDLVKDHVAVRTDARGGSVVEQTGEASWYGARHHGRKTAAGERFDQHALTAAHPTLPLGTKATVTNLETGAAAEVTINDRGPYVKGRDIDLSKASARKIGLGKDGAAPVKIEAVVSPAPAQSPSTAGVTSASDSTTSSASR